MRTTKTLRQGSVAALLTVIAIVAVWSILAPQAQAQTVRLNGVRTALTTDPGTTTALFKAGIIPLPVGPSRVVPTSDAARYTFPVTGGRVDAKTLAGSIFHSGGLLLAQRTDTDGWKALSLTRFTIRITDHPFLSAVVNGQHRLAIAGLDLGAAKVNRFVKGGHAYVRVSNVGVTLNATATGAINQTFGVSLPDTVKLGTATVLARAAH